jgi:hypothetical protein
MCINFKLISKIYKNGLFSPIGLPKTKFGIKKKAATNPNQ